VASGTDPGLGLTYLLDTNSLIYYFQGAPQLDPVFRQIESGKARPVVSIITEIELLGFPRLTRQDEARIQTLLSGFTVVAVDKRIAGQAVALKRRHGIKTPDAIIAATALAENACLVTRDQDLLQKVPEVRSLDPFGRNP
jgi:predicted nucleic acid-binding protein